MIEMHKILLALAAGVLAVGYCVYFNKRRNDGRSKRSDLSPRRSKTTLVAQPPPDPDDHEAMLKYFMVELKRAKDLITCRDFDSGVLHLANAIKICNEQHKLLQLLEHNLPDNVFTSLMMKIQDVNAGQAAAAAAAAAAAQQTDAVSRGKFDQDNVEAVLNDVTGGSLGGHGF